jgi:predicted transcriptional regulator
MEKALELESRKIIFELIRSKPGTYLREIERELGMGIGMLTYHLKVLVDAGMIRTEKEGNHIRYFISNSFIPQNQRTLSYLRNRSSRIILIHTLDRDSVSLPQLSDLTGLSPSTLNYHLKRLSSAGLIMVLKEEHITVSVVNPEEMLNMLVWVREEIEKDPVEIMTEVWDRLRSRKRSTK